MGQEIGRQYYSSDENIVRQKDREQYKKTILQNEEKKIDKTTRIQKRMKDNEEKKIHIFIPLLPFLHSLWREPAGGKVIREGTDNKDKM